MIVRLLYFIALVLLARLLWRSVVRVLEIGATGRRVEGAGAGRAPAVYKGAMVRDPVCGIHVPQDRALVELRGNERFYFCSDRCASDFRRAGV